MLSGSSWKVTTAHYVASYYGAHRVRLRKPETGKLPANPSRMAVMATDTCQTSKGSHTASQLFFFLSKKDKNMAESGKLTTGLGDDWWKCTSTWLRGILKDVKVSEVVIWLCLYLPSPFILLAFPSASSTAQICPFLEVDSSFSPCDRLLWIISK